jgi:glycosyltransferase involved in cell wall biosynthesis
MRSPVISIILPVYNGELYLKSCIDSILHQTFKEFELIIINDGSSDKTESIIKSFTDERIIYIQNERNLGLIYSLNSGIEVARGEFLARMDADDIALPERLMEQKNYLVAHPNCGIVAGQIIFIDPTGEYRGDWALDIKTIDYKAILKTMPFENCLAHPSIMGRTKIFKDCPYDPMQEDIEDYHLWLKMLSIGIIIEKINHPVLLYRDNPISITNQILRKKNFFFRHARMKKYIIVEAIKKKKVTGYHFLIFIAMVKDLVNGCAKAIKSILK